MISSDLDTQGDGDNGAHWLGGCACGEVRYAYQGRPVLSLKCYCLDCQAWSGAGHIAALWGWRDGFRLTAGEPHYHAAPGDSGKTVGRGSCKSCGSALLLDIGLIPNVVGMIATSLDDPERFTPEFAIWTSRARSWDRLDSSLQQFERGFARDVIVPRLRGRTAEAR